MEDIEYENFLPNVRESLYGKTRSSVKRSKSSRKFKSVSFNSDHDIAIHNSHSKFRDKKSDKLQFRKATPYKTKYKKLFEHEDNSSSEEMPKLKKVRIPKKKPKPKRQLVISFSSSDSFEEQLENDQLTPSKSELETFQNVIEKANKSESDSDSNSEDEESRYNFDLDAFFKTRDMSELNESVTEAHSGINYEFVSDFAKDANIIESESLCNKKEDSEHDIDNYDDNEDVFEESVSELYDNKDLSTVTDKIQESMVLSDTEYSVSPPESPPMQEEKSVAEYHDFEDRKLIVLKENQSVSFHGFFTLKVLHGKLNVLGSILDSKSEAVNLYSPRGSALLCIQNVTEYASSKLNIGKFLSTQNRLENSNYIVDENCAIFLCAKLEDPKITFLEKYIAQKIFPRLEKDNVIQVVFEPPEKLNTIKISPLWNGILNNVNCDTKLLIAGGKGVGKSTLLRYAINRLLHKFSQVRVLDLDPGQSEFAVPGCVSIVTVTEPVFGPNFTHLKQTDRSILSNINTGHDPRAYIKCIKSLCSYMKTLNDNCPTLINYMGFSQGIGLNIIASAIYYVQPTDIVQICSKNYKRNFPVDLKCSEMERHWKLFLNGDATDLSYQNLNYQVHMVPAMNDENDGWVVEPRLSREMCVLAYLGQIMESGVNSLTSHELPMYEIKLSETNITNLQGAKIHPATANANLVALCYLEQESKIYVCLGYGVVRGIDLENDKLVLITPEPATVLEQVCYLVVGSVSLPPSIYMTPDEVTGTVPYVMEGELVSLGQITRRSYLPANKT